MKLFVVSPSGELSGCSPAYMEYRIGAGFHLYRTERTFSITGGLMGISCVDAPGEGQTGILTGEILRECSLRNYSGILLETPQKLSPLLTRFIQELDNMAHQKSLLLFLREAPAENAPHSVVLVGTALSGGTYSRYLQERIDAFGVSRIALDIERTCMDFALPARDGEGSALSRQEFTSLRQRNRSPAFFSDELQTYYFTYRRSGGAHFVLYDTATSITRKISVAEKLGIKYGFLYYPEVSDILDGII